LEIRLKATSTYHNVFEKHHRFIGWLGLAVRIIPKHIVVDVTKCKVDYLDVRGDGELLRHQTWAVEERFARSYQRTRALVCRLHDRFVRRPRQTLQPILTRHSILIPWVTLREVSVEVEIVSSLLDRVRKSLTPDPKPSPKVAILRFERGMQQGLLGRISRTSIMEYHAFGIISEGRKSTHHYMICGVQGDFTKDLVANPPKTVWTRELKFGMLIPTRTCCSSTNYS